MPTPVRIVRLTGPAIRPYLPDVARLRLRVFREFPYLYDGKLEQEEQHLRLYADSPGSVVVVALAGDVAVGVSTALPMIHEPPRLHAVETAFGVYLDYARLVKIYGQSPGGEKRYSPAECIGCKRHVVVGKPDFGRVHKTLRVTPAMEAGITDHVWTAEEVAGLLGAMGDAQPRQRGPYKARAVV